MQIKVGNSDGIAPKLKQIFCFLLVLSAAELVSAYVAPNKKPRPLTALEIVEQTKRKYAKARFCKPQKLDPAQAAHEFAPLIVEELKETENPPTPKMGMVDNRDRTLFQGATVYFQAGTVHAGDQKLEQIYFLWAYPGGLRSCFVWGAHIRGMRVVLGADGMPLLWEALRDGNEDRIFFVAQSLENAAKRQFGAPLLGRHFAIERSIQDAPRIFVASILDDGPVPMGPYVYVDSSTERNITSMHCRCSPSQFEEAVQTMEYQLLPAENLDAKSVMEHADIDLEKLREVEPLDKLFRWPSLQP